MPCNTGGCPFRKPSGNASQVVRSVNVKGASRIPALDLCYEFWVRSQEGAGPGIADGHLDDGVPVLAGDENGITWLAIVGSDGHRNAVGVGADQPPDRVGPDQRLVSQCDDGRADLSPVTVGGYWPDRRVSRTAVEV